MTHQLRVIVADDEPDMQEFFSEMLSRLGHEVVFTAENGHQLIEQARLLEPDLVVTDIKMPDMDGLDAAKEIYRDRALPIVVVSAYHDDEFVRRAAENHVLAYLVKPIRAANLAPAISIALRRFGEFRTLQDEAASLRQALEDRKLIERAKGILMTQANLGEEEAFRRLQKLASSHNKKMVEIARMIVVTAEALSPKEP